MPAPPGAGRGAAHAGEEGIEEIAEAVMPRASNWIAPLPSAPPVEKRQRGWGRGCSAAGACPIASVTSAAPIPGSTAKGSVKGITTARNAASLASSRRHPRTGSRR